MSKVRRALPAICSRPYCNNAVDPTSPFIMCLRCREQSRTWGKPSYGVDINTAIVTGFTHVVGMICDACVSRDSKCVWPAQRDPRRQRTPRCFHCIRAGGICHIGGRPVTEAKRSARSASAHQPQSRTTISSKIPGASSQRTISTPHLRNPAVSADSSFVEPPPDSDPDSDADADTQDGYVVEHILSGLRRRNIESTLAPTSRGTRKRARMPASPTPAPVPASASAFATTANAEPDSDPEIVEIPRPVVKVEASGPVDRTDDEVRLREAVRALAVPTMDADARVPIIGFLLAYFGPRVGRHPSDMQCEVARTLLANVHLDEELKKVLRKFYEVMWTRAR